MDAYWTIFDNHVTGWDYFSLYTKFPSPRSPNSILSLILGRGRDAVCFVNVQLILQYWLVLVSRGKCPSMQLSGLHLAAASDWKYSLVVSFSYLVRLEYSYFIQSFLCNVTGIYCRTGALKGAVATTKI
jgi:hypothetical protein